MDAVASTTPASLSAGATGAAPASASARPPRERLDRFPAAIGLILVATSLIVAIGTYLILTGETSIEPTRELAAWLLATNAVLVAALLAVIGWQVIVVARARAKGTAGARLHVRLVTMFGVVAVVPAILVAVFATVTLDRGLDSWFSARTRAIIDNAQDVAEAYMLEHTKVIRGDILAMANDLNRNIELYRQAPETFADLLTQQARLRALSAAFVIRGDGQIGVQAIANRQIKYTPPPPLAVEQAEEGQVVIFEPAADYMVRALVRLPDFERGYLYVFRKVDQTVVDSLLETRARRAEYDALETGRTGVQAAFAMLYVGMSLIFLLAAIWFGLWVANRLVSPLGKLIDAARRVSDGELETQVEIGKRDGDIASLGRTFNEMIARLGSQRGELIATNATLDDRRRFMEAVLSGVTAGVIGLDHDGRVELANRSALELLGTDMEDLIGRSLAGVKPEFAPLLAGIADRGDRAAEQQITLVIDGDERTVHARVASELEDERAIGDRGLVLTFDDVTELQAAQRSSAWADIARRIAHEIKNPLTPIQLSAERLRRKYGKSIETDREVFEQCTATIIRQVGDIGRMVDEFSSFARMPKANFERGNFAEVVRDAVVLQKMSLQDIDFEVRLPEGPIEFAFDRRLVTQALTNLVKNASEAIEAAELKEGERGRIEIEVSRLKPGRIAVDVIDNGCGLPQKDRGRLTEPYMTTREKGTGLGLAIVRRIAEEHDGAISLDDAPAVADGGRGARVRLEFPMREAAGPAISPDGPAAKKDKNEHKSKETESS